ncbi:Cleavage and polyadenylation specificity factor subunit [Drechslerella dactyloides]|uniref:Cleavage and polyadenylation specificity factor subunit n=1 Tax=Drechslerella dactyloides TaxID=74499 RepID=A0AAD6J3G8_DREDA|nr:Cleavage and polyadenylation specificity factor subunit [Drechslerella dactyloides]
MSTITRDALQSGYPPTIPQEFSANQPKTIRLYPLSNYTFGTKENQPEEDPSVLARLQRLQEHYEKHGMRRTCEGILVCHEHCHPHILMLQIANAFFKLPGDYLQPDEDEISGFKARLNERLAPVGNQFSGEGVNDEWEIGDTLAQWWRPNFETFMYPFIPAHVTRPKEVKKLYFIHLPRSKVLSVPKNMKLLAVPLFELYDNTARYGPQLSAIPHLLSRYNFEFVDENGKVIAQTPGRGVSQNPTMKHLAGGTNGDGNDVGVGANAAVNEHSPRPPKRKYSPPGSIGNVSIDNEKNNDWEEVPLDTPDVLQLEQRVKKLEEEQEAFEELAREHLKNVASVPSENVARETGENPIDLNEVTSYPTSHLPGLSEI